MNTEESSHEENVISFYNLTEYEEWKTQNLLSPKDYQSYFIKYYKGLGTNTGEEGKEYFRNIHHHQKDFISENKQQTSDSIDLVFNKNRALDRKEWLLKNYSPSLFINFTPNTIASHPTTTSQPSPLSAAASSASTLSYSDFINKELIHFSFSDNVRSIPHLIDGLKPSQRKVLFGSFLKFPPSSNINKEMKVMQLAGFIAEKTSYHHGEQSLHSTIIHMAQQYLGANNVPLLQGIGQFGTRAKGGDDYASPRYIYTKLSPLTRYLFPVEDDILLKYQEDDGISIEPEYFMPILPTLLLNGSKGIGTGWSTDIPAYYIIDVIDHLLAKIEKDCVSSTTILQEERTLTPSKPLVPYYHGFKGRIFLENPSDGDASSDSEIAVSPSSQEFISEGRLRIIDRQTIEITELPIQKWTEDYKEFLLKLIEKGEIKSFQEFHTIHSIKFIVKLSSQLVSKHIIDKKATSRKRKSSKKTMSASSIKGINDSKGGGEENSVDDDDDDDEAEEEEEHHKVSTSQKYNHPQNQQKWKNYFRLTNRILLSNMYLFNEKNQIQRFTSPEQIIDTFYPLRLQYYQYRQQYLFQSIYQQYYTLANQQRFLQLILEAKDGSPQGGGAGGGKEGNILQQLSSSEKKEEMIVLLQSYRLASEDEIIKQLQDVLLKKYLVEQLHPRLFKTLSSHYSSGLHKEEEDHSGTAVANKGNEGKIADGIESREAYDYLLKLPIYSFTKERYSSLQNRIQDTEKKIQYLESLTPYDLWKEDLLNCRKKYLEIEKKWKFD